MLPLTAASRSEPFPTGTEPRSAYVHIPFCRRRCFYCDFPISVLGNRRRGEDSGSISAYVDLLVQEIEATPVLGGALRTVFFGGGTPSLLAVAQLARIFAALRSRFSLAPTAEISMEMDPATFNLAHIQGYAALGINRVSLGVQAFQDELLSACGRFHRVADVFQSVAHLHAAGVTNWSLDLIAGLPHQTAAQWRESLQQAIALQPTHISVYDLTVEPQTPFGRTYQPGVAPLPSELATVAFYRQARQALTTAGYDHYEISNYARPGYRCQHNLTYWRNQPYYGFGLGATSYTQHQRFGRPRTRREYATWVGEYQTHGQLDCLPTPPLEQLCDRLMVGLRLSEGVSLNPLRQLGSQTLDTVIQALKPYQVSGQVILVESDGDMHLRLSDPDGFLISNAILVDLFQALDGAAKAQA